MKPAHGEIRDLTPAACRGLLVENYIGRIGCYFEGYPYVVPITYVFSDESVFCHSRDGKKLRAMRSHPKVCFEIDQYQGINRWKSVIAFGTFEELHGDAATAAMRQLIQRIAKERHDNGGSSLEVDIAAQLETAIIFKIKLEKVTGRYEHS